jgi:Concanavalin A-like lectin/glucanases superfamily
LTGAAQSETLEAVSIRLIVGSVFRSVVGAVAALTLASCGGTASLSADGAAGAGGGDAATTDGPAGALHVGLAGAWPLDLDGRDVSGNGLDLDVTGIPLATGHFGKGLAFSGVAGATIAQRHVADASLDLATGDFTVSFWISFNATSSPQFVLAKNYADGGWFVGWAQTQWAYGFPSPKGGTFADPTVTPATGTFHHVVFERSGDSARMLIDGTLVGTASVTDNPAPSAAAFQVGGYSTGGLAASRNVVNGIVDDVAIWHRALEANELAYINAHAVATGL